MDKEEIIHKIKKSKKYSGITIEVISREVGEFIGRVPGYERLKESFILKQIKSRLHKIYGSFQTTKKNKAKKLLEKLRDKKDNKIVREILETNLSTKERLASYGFVYGEIFKRSKDIDTILDLGCGLNPLSYPYMELENDIKYYAYDINENDLDIVKEFFSIYRVENLVSAIDLRNLNDAKKLPPADICFMFKLLDPLEKNSGNHKLSEEIIKILSHKCRFVVVSFSTKTLSGRQMNHPYRGWIERMLSRIGLKFEKFGIPNEIFYFIKANE